MGFIGVEVPPILFPLILRVPPPIIMVPPILIFIKELLV